MDEAFIRRLFETLTRWVAIRVAATEAYSAAIIDLEQTVPELRQLAHLRPENATAATTAQARQAFEDLIARCLSEDKDGAIEVIRSDIGHGKQFCLIHLLRDQAKQATVVIAAIIICRDIAEARERLTTMQSLS